jgi:hypothetical protein
MLCISQSHFILYPKMSEVNAVGTILVRLGFTEDATIYMIIHAGLDSLAEVGYLDDDDVENLVKRVNESPWWVHHSWNWNIYASTTTTMGFMVYIWAESNLKLCVFYLRHCTRTTRTPTVTLIDLNLVRGFRDQRKWENNFKKTKVEPVINYNDWPRTDLSIKVFLTAYYKFDQLFRNKMGMVGNERVLNINGMKASKKSSPGFVLQICMSVEYTQCHP